MKYIIKRCTGEVICEGDDFRKLISENRSNLSRCDLSWCDLSGSNLSGSNLSWSNLSWSNLSGSNLSGCDLYGCNLSGCNLSGCISIKESINLYLPIACPDTGDFTGWKKCEGSVLVKLLIPSKAKRSSASGRKCRAEYVKVLDVIGAKEGISKHDKTVKYVKGKIVKANKFDEDRWHECSSGIHFFITKQEAIDYQYEQA